MELVIGIDPGITGAMAALDAHTLQLVDVIDFPTVTEGKKQRIFSYGMANILRHWQEQADHIAMVYLEQVHAMPKQGVTSMFNMGRSFGTIEGVISTINLPLTYISGSRNLGVISSLYFDLYGLLTHVLQGVCE